MYFKTARLFHDDEGNRLSLTRIGDTWLVHRGMSTLGATVSDADLSVLLKGWMPLEPWAGDAVRLSSPWRWGNLPAGSIGIIGGVVGATHMTAAGITFKYSCFRGKSTGLSPASEPEFGSCSGGPGTIATALAELVPAAEAMWIICWRWKELPCKDDGVHYKVTVPVWDWSPAD